MDYDRVPPRKGRASNVETNKHSRNRACRHSFLIRPPVGWTRYRLAVRVASTAAAIPITA